jgi:hypothetical protein
MKYIVLTIAGLLFTISSFAEEFSIEKISEDKACVTAFNTLFKVDLPISTCFFGRIHFRPKIGFVFLYSINGDEKWKYSEVLLGMSFASMNHFRVTGSNDNFKNTWNKLAVGFELGTINFYTNGNQTFSLLQHKTVKELELNLALREYSRIVTEVDICFTRLRSSSSAYCENKLLGLTEQECLQIFQVKPIETCVTELNSNIEKLQKVLLNIEGIDAQVHREKDDYIREKGFDQKVELETVPGYVKPKNPKINDDQ